jgi:CheY-like chemotaxis protein
MLSEGPLVLVVDDEPHVRRPIALLLRGAGYRVLEAGNRTEAMRCGGGPEPIALLVCDVQLPGDCGLEVAKALTTVQPGLPTLFVSGLTYEGDMGSSGVPAPSDFLLKPFDLDALLAKASELLQDSLTAAS